MVGGDDDESVIVWIRVRVGLLSKAFRDADSTIELNRLPDRSFCIHPMGFLIYGGALNHQKESVWVGRGKRSDRGSSHIVKHGDVSNSFDAVAELVKRDWHGRGRKKSEQTSFLLRIYFAQRFG